ELGLIECYSLPVSTNQPEASSLPTLAVIEDNDDSRLLLRIMLEGRYQLVEYPDGQQGLEGLRRQRPDLLLLDISLPVMDGIQVLRRLRRDMALKDLPVIALTAHALSGEQDKLLANGFDAYVGKPIVDEQRLFAAIDGLLSRSG
ncbi:MAG: response regulator, partial [Acidobacteriota bacterium]|nr:response regulator [Acidobacteriota bacterium]